jgi:hypothetical protein
MLREHIHVLKKRPQDIPRSPRSSCAVVASRTIDTQPLPHDRDCPQSNLVLRRRVRDSHHPMGGNLPSYLFIGALLQKSKLHKVNAESKTQLACHLLRLLQSLYWLLNIFSPWFLKIWPYAMYYTCNTLIPAVTSHA